MQPISGGRPHRPHGHLRVRARRTIPRFAPARGAEPSRGGHVKIIVLGGAEEVGRNCTLIEYKDDIILIDCGLQFPEEDMPGIDYVIPNISYLKGKERNVRGMLITHGHYDHIGGIDHIAPKLGNPPIFGTKLTIGIIKKRHADFEHLGPLDLRVIDPDRSIRLGVFTIEFFRVNHNIPDCVGMVVRTPEGNIMHTGDMKFDFTPVIDKPADFGRIATLGKQGVHLLLSDSTNANKPGHQLSESEIGKELEKIFAQAEKRIIVATFSSLLSRVQQVIWLTQKYKRRLVIEGFSMRTTSEVAQQLGYLDIPKDLIISPQQANKLPPSRVVIMCTGAQGEDRAALMRIASREHRFFSIEPGDSILFSSSVVPGNERSVARLRDALLKEGAQVYHYQMMDIHAGGHAQQEDLKLLFSLVRPIAIAPIMGEHAFLKDAASVAKRIGYDDKQIITPLNGQVIELARGKATLTKTRVPTDYVFVDGLGVGDVSHVVLRDRQHMANDGIVVIITNLDSRTGNLLGSPDIISRGFVYMKDSKRLIEETRDRVKAILKDKNPDLAANPMFLRKKLQDDIGQFLFTKTERQPLIIPVVINI
jgi:ribonuclease J